MFLGRSHSAAVGLGFLGLAGAAVLGFPVYPRSCAGGWSELGAGGRSALAETSPVPKHRRSPRPACTTPTSKRLFMKAAAAAAIRW